MHATTTALGNTYHHNGDYSGTVKFDATVIDTNPDDESQAFVEIPFADMLELVMDHLASAARQRLGMADTQELIKLLVRP